MSNRPRDRVSYYWHFVDVVWIRPVHHLYLLPLTGSRVAVRRSPPGGGHPAAGCAVILAALLLVAPGLRDCHGWAASAAALTSSADRSSEGDFQPACRVPRRFAGRANWPGLIGVGAAAGDFRSAPAGCGQRARRRAAARAGHLHTARIHALAAYIALLGGGGHPCQPRQCQGANTGLGQQLFVADCAQCHNFGRRSALCDLPCTAAADNHTRQIFEAMLTGPRCPS